MEKIKKFLKQNQKAVLASLLAVLIGGLILWSLNSKKDEQAQTETIENEEEANEPKGGVPLNQEGVSPLSGLPCENHKRRAIGVMQAGDVSTRPLSGFSDADMIFEMPVITASITRLMGVYLCNSPKEIGSIRSARHDYVTIAKGIDAMLAHWGGSHFALEILKNKNTVPDLDAMNNTEGAFFRKDGIPAPDNGFASHEGLWKMAEKMGYRLENQFEGYPHQTELETSKRPTGGNLRIGFAGVYGVNYTYDPKTNSFLRSWGGKEDIDKANGKRLAPKNIVVAFATSRQIEGQYNDVDIEGSGEMHAYINGQEIIGTWTKEKKDCVIGNELVCVTDSKLKFLDDKGEEIKFVPGQIWVEILEPGQALKWEPTGSGATN